MKMLAVSALLCAMLALTRAFPAYGWWEPSCPDGWTNVGYRCLLYIPEKMTWAEAEENCRLNDGSLAAVFEHEQFAEMRELMQKAGHKSGQVWVGGHKAPEDSSWSWSDHMSPVMFPNKCPGGPTKENCLKIVIKDDATGCWKDMRCDAKLPSVCSMFIM
ncbi:hypothetical protein ABVT39_013978 [Epinephelus coioides]